VNIDKPLQQNKLRKSHKFRVLLVTAFFVLSTICSGFVVHEANAASSSTATIFFSGSIQTTTSAFLHTNGTKILNAANQEIVFNGISTMTLFGYEQYASGGFLPVSYTPAGMTIIRSHGLNLVRLDIQLNAALYGVPASQQTPTNLTYNSQFFPVLDGLVNQCAKEGLWVNLCFGTSDSTWAPLGGVFGSGNGFPKWMYDGSWSYFHKIYPNTIDGRDSAIRDFWNINDPTAANVRTAYQTFWKDMATHFKNSPNVIFGLYNEPENQWGGNTSIWSDQALGATSYKTFMEATIDIIQNVAPNNLIFQNDAYFWSYTTNLKIDRPNVVVECHAYSVIDQNFVNLGYRYNQPFILGEFGGIEEGLQTRADTITNMQFCNSVGASRSYLSYRPSNGYPSAQTWTDLQTYLITNIKYYTSV
jgi:hypothetical protein